MLIVYDMGLFIQLQIARLGQSRFEIHGARTGTEALEKARSVSPDLILLDLHMPDVNGENVCRLLKEDFRTRSIPVIIVSSGASDHKNSDCISAGCDGLIHKPIRRASLLSMVGQRLGISIRRWRRTSVDLPCRVILYGQEINTHPLPLRRRGLYGTPGTSHTRQGHRDPLHPARRGYLQDYPIRCRCLERLSGQGRPGRIRRPASEFRPAPSGPYRQIFGGYSGDRAVRQVGS